MFYDHATRMYASLRQMASQWAVHLTLACTLTVILITAPSANASSAYGTFTIDFDDISTTDSIAPIPDGYHGFDWTNFSVIHQDHRPGSGYDNGTVSGNYVGFNDWGFPAESLNVRTAGNGVFNFNSAYLTAAWNDGLEVTVSGLLDGNFVYGQTVTVDTTGPTLFTFDYKGIDQLRFYATGGTNADLGDTGMHFAMDNFTYTVVPTPTAAFAGLALLTGLYTLRRLRAHVPAADQI